MSCWGHTPMNLRTCTTVRQTDSQSDRQTGRHMIGVTHHSATRSRRQAQRLPNMHALHIIDPTYIHASNALHGMAWSAGTRVVHIGAQLTSSISVVIDFPYMSASPDVTGVMPINIEI